jgi:dTDP-4-dehydrorhamnose reductase
MRRIYITGIEGELGKSLQKKLSNYNFVDGSDLKGKNKIDICDYEKISKDIKKFKPDIIIHCAAFVDVDKCEEKKENCKAVNIEGTKNIVKISEKLGCRLFYISTHAVYRGNADGFNTEESLTFPTNAYIESKIESEKIVSQYENSVILRSNHYSTNTKFYSFVKQSEKKPIEVYYNMIVSMISVDSITEVIEKIISTKIKGIYNIGNGFFSKYDFAVKYAELMGIDKKNIIPIKYENSKQQIKRPLNISASTKKIESEGIYSENWKTSLEKYIKDQKN